MTDGTRNTDIAIDRAPIPEVSDVSNSHSRSPRAVFVVATLLLFTAGWATNHFSTMVAVLRDQENFSTLVVNGAFGIYALGLVPCLLLGGLLADRFGARPVVLFGALAAAFGNFLLLLWQSTGGLFLGRFIIGLGVGLAISAGTAWAGTLRGAHGVVLAGIVLSAGFAVGPIVSGMLAYVLPPSGAISIPYMVTIGLSLLAIVAALLVSTRDSPPLSPDDVVHSDPTSEQGGMGRALATSIPMALWVFSTAAIAMITLTERVGAQFDTGVLFPGFAALLAFTAALVAQALGRHFGWGPKAGIAGALFGAAGFILGGLGAATPPMWLFIGAVLLLGTSYGLCLREGLLDVEAYAPPARRGATLGIYYVFTYLGFALPVVLEWLLPVTGYTAPLLLLGALALASALIRALQLRTGVIDRH
ncbi:MAG TPA: MFS transporter [Enteractinococcus sp.]